MSTCGHSWCDTELRIDMDDGVIVRHRGMISRLTVDAVEVCVTVTVLGDREPVIGVEIAEWDDGGASTPLVAATATEVWTLLYGLTDTIERIVTDLARDRGETPDLGEVLRKSAEKEREQHGPYLRMGPFDDSPMGLSDQISEHFTTAVGVTDRGASWLLGVLASRNVETGATDRDVAREIVDDLGADAAQVVGGWVFRAA